MRKSVKISQGWLVSMWIFAVLFWFFSDCVAFHMHIVVDIDNECIISCV